MSYLIASQAIELRKHVGLVGGRVLYQLMAPEGIGRDAFFAIMAAHGLLVRPPKRFVPTTQAHPSAQYDNLLEELWLTDVNQAWVSDITYHFFDGRFVYLHHLMDLYSRRILGFCMATTLRASATLQMLRMAPEVRQIKHYDQQLIHHSDRGGQYISNTYVKLLKNHGIRISMCENVYDNIHMERVNGTIKHQYLNYWEAKNWPALKRITAKRIDAYNRLRPHQSLNMLTPIDFEASLKDVPLDQRVPMRVFTQKGAEHYNGRPKKGAKPCNQLSLFEQ